MKLNRNLGDVLHVKLCGTLAKTALLCDNGALHVEDSIVIGGKKIQADNSHRGNLKTLTTWSPR
jgi:hypothetical protein